MKIRIAALSVAGALALTGPRPAHLLKGSRRTGCPAFRAARDRRKAGYSL